MRPDMDPSEHHPPRAPIIFLTDSVGTAVQLVPRFGYDETANIMLDAIETDDRIDHLVRRHAA